MAGMEIIFVGLLLALLVPLALIDLRERRIPNALNLALAVLGLAHGLYRDSSVGALMMVFAQAGLTFAILAATASIMRTISRRAYVGWGDIKFLVAISLWVGLNGSAAVLIIACVINIAWVIAISPWRGLKRDRLQPFGPMLALATLVIVALDGAAS